MPDPNEALRARCEGLDRGIRAIGAWTDAPPGESRHQRAVDALVPGGAHAGVIRSQADFLMESLAEHASVVGLALTPPVASLSSLTLLRAVLEAASQLAWLLEPGISPRDRIVRSLELRAADVGGQRSIAAENGDDTAGVDARLNKIRAEATSLGATSLPTRLNLTARAREFGAGDDYKVLSNVAHSRSTFVRQFGYQQDGEPEDDTTRFKKFANPVVVEYVLASTLKWFAEAAWLHAEYLERPGSELKLVLRTMSDDVQIHLVPPPWMATSRSRNARQQ